MESLWLYIGAMVCFFAAFAIIAKQVQEMSRRVEFLENALMGHRKNLERLAQMTQDHMLEHNKFEKKIDNFNAAVEDFNKGKQA